MDNWREGMRTGHTHEPNDATIQLDGLGRQLAELPGEPAPPEGSDGPVFVDESGRRSKTFRRLGWVLATVCTGYAVTLVFAVLGGNSSAPWLPLSGPKEEAQAEQVEDLPETGTVDDGLSDGSAPEPGPSASGSPTADASGTPAGATPSATSVVVPAGSAERPSASAPADPSRPATGGGGGGATKPAPTTSAAEPPVDPTPPTTEPEPTESTAPPVEDPEQPVQEESAP
ncbi:hypothetical protein [Streptomyces sindenensis]|uniref:Translation initiation factor IF-2 n=1 Tax=Streptomyces sindenensis TaxID=67363 RepID=A0ABW6ESF5_9ACTN